MTRRALRCSAVCVAAAIANSADGQLREEDCASAWKQSPASAWCHAVEVEVRAGQCVLAGGRCEFTLDMEDGFGYWQSTTLRLPDLFRSGGRAFPSFEAVRAVDLCFYQSDGLVEWMMYVAVDGESCFPSAIDVGTAVEEGLRYDLTPAMPPWAGKRRR